MREAVFNALFSLDAIDGARVLDLFAGSGALGIEALSRGASHCTFVEHDREALRAVRDNLAALGFDDGRARVVAGDATAYLGSGSASHADLVLLDPPYAFEGWDELLEPVHDAVVVIESDREITLPPGWGTHRVRRYGSTVVTIAIAPPASETASP